jgi:hypothetical protein
MTDDRTFDRLTRAWLDLMPDEAPDRTVEAVLQAVATTPQVRRPWRWLPWRSTPMNRATLAIGTTAVIVAAGALYFGISNSSSTVGPSPTPTVTATPTGAGSPLPSELQSRWFGGHRDIVQLDKGSTLLFSARGFVMNEANQWDSIRLLSSTAAVVGDGQLRLELNANGNGCEARDVGTYSWSLSPSGRTLTITPGSDDCAARSSAVPGVWWLAGCPNELCLAELDAGTYQSQYIVPRLDPGAAWEPDFGGLTYTVPEGWANSSDAPESFELVPAAEVPPVAESDRRRNIGVFTQPTAMTQDRPCSDQIEPGVGRTVDDLVAWLQTVPGLIATAPTEITIDGHPGQWLDLRRNPTWTKTCEGSGAETLVTFLNPGIAVGEDQRVRLILLDLGDGDVVATGIWTRDQATLDEFVPEAMPVIESFTFE